MPEIQNIMVLGIPLPERVDYERVATVVVAVYEAIKNIPGGKREILWKDTMS